MIPIVGDLPSTARPLQAMLLLALAAPLHAQTRVTPADRTSLELTVYAGFAQVRDTRSGAAEGEAVWTGFPGSIDPGTILLTRNGEPAEVTLLGVRSVPLDERSLYAIHVGEPVVLVAQDGRQITAELVSEAPVFQAGDRLILDWPGHVELPVGAAAALGREIRLLAATTGAGPLTLSYLADGLAWSADYTAILEERGRVELAGSVTIDNHTDFIYPDARIQLVAGEVRRGGGPGPPEPRVALAEARLETDETVPARQVLGDVHLYTLPRPVTVGAMETVRTPLFASVTVNVEREYVLRGQRFWYQGEHPGVPPRENPDVWLRFRNRNLAGRGEPLPAGLLHVYRRDDRGTLQFAGEGSILHTADGERIDVVIGNAFDLVAERVQTEFRRLDPTTHESAWKITIRNRSKESRTVQVYEPLAGEATIVEESRPHERVDANTVRWAVPIEAGGESVLTYRVQTRF